MNDEFAGLTGWDFEGFHSGGDTESWKRLGAHVVEQTADDGSRVRGTRFTVWAPNARSVRIRGSFNGWDGREHAMRLIPGTGVWGLFVPGVEAGAVYKYEICDPNGTWLEKVDPMARFAEAAPHNGSIVWESGFEWGDDAWLDKRAKAELWREPFSIYELHVGSWRQGLSYRDLAPQLIEYVTTHGFTHVEFMPLAEHPFTPSWGYQVTNYFAPTSRFGNPDDLRYLIDQLHQAGIGVLMDWVPGHFPKDGWALGRFDGTALYEHADPRQGEHKDWGTYIFNYGRNEVKSFLVSNALYWIQEFHVDGLRVDAVASMLYLDYSRNEGEWVPNIYGGRENLEAIDFLRYVNSHLYARCPGVVMIAEESTSFPGVTKPVDQGGLGFGFKWNMGWMNDSLRYVEEDPIYRQYNHHLMTFATVYAWSENFILPLSHDEVVHGKGAMINKVPQDYWRKFATLRSYYAFQWAFPGKQLLFMGDELAQWGEFNESAELDWPLYEMWGHGGVRRLVGDMNAIYRRSPELFRLDCAPEGFQWIDGGDNEGNTFSWLRYDGDGGAMAIVTNFSPEPHRERTLGVPQAGRWEVVLNTDDPRYDGTGEFQIAEPVEARASEGGEWPAELTVTIPPLGALWLRYVGAGEAEPTDAGEQEEQHREAEARREAEPELQQLPDPDPAWTEQG